MKKLLLTAALLGGGLLAGASTAPVGAAQLPNMSMAPEAQTSITDVKWVCKWKKKCVRWGDDYGDTYCKKWKWKKDCYWVKKKKHHDGYGGYGDYDNGY